MEPWPALGRPQPGFARTAKKPIHGTLIDQRAKAFLISTATRDRVWLPKSLVTHNAVTGVFMVPMWLATQKLLD